MPIETYTDRRKYPLPHQENKAREDVQRLILAFQMLDIDIANILLALTEKADFTHTHSMGQIGGLVSALGGKSDSDHNHPLGSLEDVDVAGVANGQFLKRVGTAWTAAGLSVSDVANLQTLLDGKANVFGNSLVVPSGGTSGRPVNPTGRNLRFNTNLNYFEYWNGSAWTPLVVSDVLAKSQNLADLSNKMTALNNLGAAKNDGSNLAWNILINSDGEINQRGMASGPRAAGVHFRDRWRAGPNGLTAYINAAIGWELYSGSVEQVCEGGFLFSRDEIHGKQITFAVDQLYGSDLLITLVDHYNPSTVIATGTVTEGNGGVRSITMNLPSFVVANFRVRIERTGNLSTYTGFRNPRLGIGPNAPIKIPRDDVVLSQRYYCRVPVTARFWASGAGQTDESPVYWPVRMRTDPTTSLVAGASRANLGGVAVGSASQSGCRYLISSAAAGDTYGVADVIVADAEF